MSLNRSRVAALPAMASTLRALRHLVNLLSHLAGPIAGPRANGGDHGGAAGLDHGGTPVWATVVQINAWTSVSGCWGTTTTEDCGGVATTTESAAELR